MYKYAILLIILIGLLQYRLWYGDGNVLEFQRLNERIEELRQEGARRHERNAALEAEVMDLKQGLEAVEEQARQDLGMIKEGEVFVQIVDPHHEPEIPPAPPVEKLAPPSTKPAPEKKSKSEKTQKSKAVAKLRQDESKAAQRKQAAAKPAAPPQPASPEKAAPAKKKPPPPPPTPTEKTQP